MIRQTSRTDHARREAGRERRIWRRCSLCLSLLLVTGGSLHAREAGQKEQEVTALTFAGEPDSLYVPVRAAAQALGWPVYWDQEKQMLFVNDQPLPDSISLKRLLNGTIIIAVRDLRTLGAGVRWDDAARHAVVIAGEQAFTTASGEKRVQIDRTNQMLRAWQGGLLVLETPISTGRAGKRTPAGEFTAGPYKARMHYSSLYNNAPMPYSVQVQGNIFIHGFRSVPDQPASHGCIRVPLDNGNPARWFYEWVDIGTPIAVEGRWQSG
jgi:hypothetical protein